MGRSTICPGFVSGNVINFNAQWHFFSKRLNLFYGLLSRRLGQKDITTNASSYHDQKKPTTTP
jgi:hypothetical protein